MTLRRIALAATIMLAFGKVGLTAEFTKGQVTKVDVKQKKVTIKRKRCSDATLRIGL